MSTKQFSTSNNYLEIELVTVQSFHMSALHIKLVLYVLRVLPKYMYI